MVKVKSLLKSVKKDLAEDNEKTVAVWLKTKKKEIRSCQKTLNALKDELRKALNQEVDDFADELLDDKFDY